MNWLNQVQKRIFPLSLNKHLIKDALSEWVYEGNVIDLGEAYEVCELCGHEGIRFQYEILNHKTNKSLLIGSECVTKFGGVNVLDENGNALPISEARKKVNKDKNKLIADAKTRSVLNSLIELAKVDTKITYIHDLEEYYKERGAFTPKQLFLIVWRLEENKIPFNKTYFKVTIKKPAEKRSLLELDDWKVKRIWESLSSSQKDILRKKSKNGQKQPI